MAVRKDHQALGVNYADHHHNRLVECSVLSRRIWENVGVHRSPHAKCKGCSATDEDAPSSTACGFRFELKFERVLISPDIGRRCAIDITGGKAMSKSRVEEEKSR